MTLVFVWGSGTTRSVFLSGVCLVGGFVVVLVLVVWNGVFWLVGRCLFFWGCGIALVFKGGGRRGQCCIVWWWCLLCVRCQSCFTLWGSLLLYYFNVVCLWNGVSLVGWLVGCFCCCCWREGGRGQRDTYTHLRTHTHTPYFHTHTHRPSSVPSPPPPPPPPTLSPNNKAKSKAKSKAKNHHNKAKNKANDINNNEATRAGCCRSKPSTFSKPSAPASTPSSLGELRVRVSAAVVVVVVVVLGRCCGGC